MKALVTGGGGCIGSHIVDRLLARGDRVCVIDNFVTASRTNLSKHNNLEVIDRSIANRSIVFDAVGSFRPDVLVHAAAAYKDPDDWSEDIESNILGSIHIVNAAVEFKVPRLIYFQTALCYGIQPLEQPVTIRHPIQPQGSSYAYSKVAAEQYLSLAPIEYVSFRLANAYGPRNITGPIPTFYQRLLDGKKCHVVDTRRDFIFIDDVVDVCMQAIADGRGTGAYHISTGSDCSIKEIFDQVVSALGITLSESVEVRPRGKDDAYSILLDPSKTFADFDWQPKVSLSKGIRKTIEYYKQHGITQTFTHLQLQKQNR